MIAYVTYCSADKRDDPGDLPAIERYLDARIRRVAARAEADGAKFLIMSGRYGLLAPEQPIPWYDHLLTSDEVDDMAHILRLQLRMHDVTELVWFTEDPEVDPLVRPYGRAVSRGCMQADVTMRVMTLEDGDRA